MVVAWWVDNFSFEVVDDSTRNTGDRFIKCRLVNGVPINISGPLDGQTLVESDSGSNLRLKHLGFDVEAELERLAAVGAPDNVRVELIQWPS